MSFTTSDLLDSIKRRTFAPANQLTYQDSELLAVADETLIARIIPDILAVREEYFVTHVDYAITANQNAYDIPVRASAGLIREVWLVDGTTVNPNFRRKEPEEITSDAAGTPDGFYLKNNQVILHPTPAVTQRTLRVFFFLTPPRHILVSAAGVISAIDTGNNIVTVASIPAAWATGNIFDLIRRNGGQEPLSVDLTSSLVSGSSITLPSLPNGLAVGDYVALAGETPLVQTPDVYRPVLAQGVAAEVLASMNQPGSDRAEALFEKLRATAQRMITPRVHGEDRLITPVNWF